MAINAEWHKQNRMPKNATFEQRAKWHKEHTVACACRPMPEKLAEEMKKRGWGDFGDTVKTKAELSKVSPKYLEILERPAR